MFAPPNSAFEKLPDGLVTKLLEPTWKPQLQDLLKYHVLGIKVMSSDISEGQQPETLNGEKITLNLNRTRVNGKSNIIVPFDVDTDNGVIHSVDSVLTPQSVTLTVFEIGDGAANFSTLVAALTAAELAGTLGGYGPFTVFGEYFYLC